MTKTKPLATIFTVMLGVSLFLIASQSFAAVSTTIQKPTTGIISQGEIGVYYDSACTNVLSSIDWGQVDPGQTVNKIIYVKNLGTANLTLTSYAAEWSNPTVGSVTVGIGTNPLSVNAVSTLTVSLTINATTKDRSFGCNLHITGVSSV